MTERSIPALIAEHVRRMPDATLLQFFDANDLDAEPRVMTYGNLWRGACHYCQSLENFSPGDVLLLVMPFSPDLFTTYVAGMLRGLIVSIYTTPSSKIQPHVYRRNLSHALENIRPSAVVTIAGFAEQIRETVESAQCRFVILQESAHSLPPNAPLEFVFEANCDSPAILQHSSGSTGMQKGVLLSHRKVIAQCRSYGEFINYDGARDVVCSWLPLYHDMGLFTTWLTPLVLGGSVCLLDPFTWVQKPSSILRLASKVGGTLIWQPNFAFSLLMDRVSEPELQTLDLEQVRGFTNCSEPVHQNVMAKFQTRFARCGVSWKHLWSCYAMAENAFAVTATSGLDSRDAAITVDAKAFANNQIEQARFGLAEKTLASCGKPVAGCQLRIVNPDRNVLADCQIGEIAIAGCG